jgi:hypothetical protein
MTKLLESAIEKVRELSAKDQDNVARALLALTGEDTPLIPLDPETRSHPWMVPSRLAVVSS